MSIEKRAMRFVRLHLKNKEKFRQVEDVSRDPEHLGYDFIARKGKETRKIEVKGCSCLWGILDPYSTEFKESTKRLVADFLYVVYFCKGKRIRLCRIPRNGIPPKFVIPRTTYRISGKFKNELSFKKSGMPVLSDR